MTGVHICKVCRAGNKAHVCGTPSEGVPNCQRLQTVSLLWRLHSTRFLAMPTREMLTNVEVNGHSRAPHAISNEVAQLQCTSL